VNLRGLWGCHYFGGCSSPFNQPVAHSVFSGSGPSQSRHWNVRCPLPLGGSARIKNSPQWGQVGRLACPITISFRLSENPSIPEETNPQNPRGNSRVLLSVPLAEHLNLEMFSIFKLGHCEILIGPLRAKVAQPRKWCCGQRKTPPEAGPAGLSLQGAPARKSAQVAYRPIFLTTSYWRKTKPGPAWNVGSRRGPEGQG